MTVSFVHHKSKIEKRSHPKDLVCRLEMTNVEILNKFSASSKSLFVKRTFKVVI